MRLHTYVNEIFDIAAENGVDVGVGRDMFLANIKNSGDESLPHYLGAEQVHYAALKPHYDDLIDGCEKYEEDIRNNFATIVALRKEKNFDGAKATLA